MKIISNCFFNNNNSLCKKRNKGKYFPLTKKQKQKFFLWQFFFWFRAREKHPHRKKKYTLTVRYVTHERRVWVTSEKFKYKKKMARNFLFFFLKFFQVENCLATYAPHACVVVYSVDDKNTFQVAEDILNYLWRENYTHEKSVILVGNKSDLARSRVISTAGN